MSRGMFPRWFRPPTAQEGRRPARQEAVTHPASSRHRASTAGTRRPRHWRQRPWTRTLRAAVPLLAAMAVSLVTGSPAIAADAPSIQLRPTGDASTGYFVLPSMPGQTVGQSVTVTNPSDRAVSAQLGPVDASTGVNGGSVFADSGVPPQGDGRWIHLSQTNLQLAPKANVVVPFTVSVPANAGPPGAHLAGITAWDPAASKASEGRGADGQARVKVTVTSRTVVG